MLNGTAQKIEIGGTNSVSPSYVHFLPKTNFFRDFPINSRPLYINSRIAGSSSVEKIVSAFNQSGHKITTEPEHACITLATVDESPFFRSAYAGLPKDFWQLAPASFVVLLPHPEHPVIWIGGDSDVGLNNAVEFCAEIIPLLKKQYLVAGDFHTHSRVSDGWGEPEEIAALAVAANLDVIALTDHNSDDGYSRMLQGAKGIENLLMLKGMELTDSCENHVLAIGDATGLPRKTPDEIIAAAQAGKVIIAQAHATSTEYFKELKEPYYIGTEAFNYLSSAPETARRYLRDCFKKGKRVLVLGNSDTHMTADIGKARTYLFIDQFTEDAVIAELREGRTCAFQNGMVVGEPSLERLIWLLHNNSDLLEGKLMPDRDIWQTPLESKSASALHEVIATLQIVESRQENRRQIYCPTTKGCDCSEQYFKLPKIQKNNKLVSGRAENVIMEINGIRKLLLLQTGESVNISQFVIDGNNILSFDALPKTPEQPRLCLGRELLDWEMQRSPEAEFIGIEPASNLQIQNLAPKGGFPGELIFRLKVENPEHCDRLFFESIDGNIDLLVNGELLTKRFGTHWEERFEVTIPSELSKQRKLEIIIKMNKQVGLSGISNRVFLGKSISLSAGQKLEFTPGTLSDLTALRWCEQRTRGFLLDDNYKIIDSFFNNGLPMAIPINATHLMLSSFQPHANPFIIK